jgi:molybdenum cofactor biosynthesis enzyme MoaA
MTTEQRPGSIFTLGEGQKSTLKSHLGTTPGLVPSEHVSIAQISAAARQVGRFSRRQEHWGSIRYDFARDEFSAEVRPGTIPLPTSPIGLGWIVIGGCNKHCIHCYGNAEQLPRQILPTADCLAIADRIAEANVMRVTLSGGEPMLRDDLPKIVASLHNHGISVILGTNGSKISEMNVADLLICTRVEISLDGSKRETNNKIRLSRACDGDSWAETIAAISLCLRAGVAVRVLTTINAYNQDQLVEMAGLLTGLGVTDWALSWTLRAGRAVQNWDRLCPDERRVLQQMSLIRRSYPMLQLRYSNRSKYNKYYCLILPDGQIATEDVMLGKKIQMGSLVGTPIAEFWNEAHYNLDQHFRKWVGRRIRPTRPKYV